MAPAGRWTALAAAVARPPSGRITNLTLLAALLLAFGTGVGAVAAGSPRGRWIVVAHGVAAILVLLLIPAKARVVRQGLRRARPSRWFSVTLAALAVGTLLAGLGHTTGLLRSVGGVATMWLHVAIALALLPLALWHVPARWVRPRRGDLSRRVVLRTGGLAALALAGYAAGEAVTRLAGWPGAARRGTGSYQVGSFDPAAMPRTSWLDDTVPAVDPARWRLTIVDGAGTRELGYPELARYAVPCRAVLDCTSGWYAEQDWAGVPLATLLTPVPSARSLYVHSVSGYWIRFPVRDLDRLLLATRVGGAPLSPGHGFPARLVAPDRRGFWWVKWVDRVELQATPWWWQPPFPVT